MSRRMSNRAVVKTNRTASALAPVRLKIFIPVCIVIALVFFGYGCGLSPEEESFQQAEIILSNGDYKEAITAYKAFLQEFPQSRYAPESLYKTAYIYNRHQRDVKNALETYEMLFYLYPNSHHAMLAREDRAEIFSMAGEQRKAIEQYTGLLKEGIREREDNYRYKIAMEYIKMNAFGQARIEFEELLKSKPNTVFAPKVYFQIATTYYLEGRLGDAVGAYDEVITRYPNDQLSIEARLGKAAAFEEAGRHTDALALLSELEDDYSNSYVIKIRIKSTRERMKKGPKLRK